MKFLKSFDVYITIIFMLSHSQHLTYMLNFGSQSPCTIQICHSAESPPKCHLKHSIQTRRLNQPPEKSVCLSTVFICSHKSLPFLTQASNSHAWSYFNYPNLSVTSQILLPQDSPRFMNHIWSHSAICFPLGNLCNLCYSAYCQRGCYFFI